MTLVSDNGAPGRSRPHGSVSEFRFAQGRDEDFDLNLQMIDELGGHRTYNHYPWVGPKPATLPFDGSSATHSRAEYVTRSSSHGPLG